MILKTLLLVTILGESRLNAYSESGIFVKWQVVRWIHGKTYTKCVDNKLKLLNKIISKNTPDMYKRSA